MSPREKLQKVLSQTTTFFLIMGISLSLFGLKIPMAQAEEADCHNEWTKQSLDWLMSRLGYSPPFYFCYEINAGKVETIYITFDDQDLEMGDNHLIMAECDNDCSDINLRVYDDQYRLIGEDNLSDSYAEVRIDHLISGASFYIELEMYSCNADFCGAVLATTPIK
jgi:hypothetical protein